MQKSTRLQHISCVPRQDADEGTYGRFGTEHNPPVHVLPGKNEKSKVSMGNLQPAQNLKRFCSGLYGVHKKKHVLRVLLVLDALAQRKDRHREFISQAPIAGAIMDFSTAAGMAVFVICRNCWFSCRCSSCILRTDDTECLALDFKERAPAGFAGLFEHFTPFEEVFSHYFIFFAHWHTFTVVLIFNLYMPVRHINYRYTGRCSHAKP